MKESKHYRYLQEFQAKRLERDYQHFRQKPEFLPLTDFFLTEMYGPQDFAARDAQARRLHHFTHIAPGLSMRDIQVTLDLLELTVQLDKQLADVLIQMDAPVPFSEELYEDGYYRADAYKARVQQIELIDESLRRVHRLAHMPLLGAALNNSKTMAKVVGMGELHRFLRKGYNALQNVNDLTPFLDEVVAKEMSRLNRIYKVSE